MPAGLGSKPQKASASETWSNVADKLGARPGGSDKENMDFDMAEIKGSELGLQWFRTKCALTYPTRYFSPLEDEVDLVGNSLDHHSTDSYLSSSPNCSSKNKVLVESVDSVDDGPLFPEPDKDLSDWRATNLDDEDLGDEELLNPRHAAEIAFYDDNDDLDGAGATGYIIPPPLAPGDKFNITSTMIQLLQLKGLFGGPAGDDPNMHLVQEEAYAVPKSSYDQCPLDGDIIQASDMLDRMTKQSRYWNTRDSEVASSTISIGMTPEQRRREDERHQYMVHIKTKMDLLTKHLLLGKTENVNAVVLKGRDKSDSEEEANYLNNQGDSDNTQSTALLGL
ncbi:hypothetical protein CQW23_29792 [Capsicum baccatum]|uniref:Uncharacterized protein n=1 Tax=Capsicum baccatum TaxID=33114 RepID=A0A2G2VC94_CAPBA|nr:hypothetical protein CQW23_29792 [Capsicum baccatum]